MNVTEDLLHIVEQAHSLARILDAASRVVAERLRVDGCFVFLLDTHGDLVRAAAGGPDSKGARAAAEVEPLAARVFAERRASAAHGETTSLRASPMLLRDRTVGALVLQGGAQRDWS